jgi:DNA repair protein RecN (Recombination protein N)
MLTELSIENFAIIDRLLLRLEDGFTVLTGETGAGKSIIIDALQAALGARVGSDVVRTDARYAAVEAVFDVPRGGSAALDTLRTEQGLDEDDVLILRREISASGRSSARLNGRAVPVGVLAAAGSALVDIHGQSDHLSVLRRDRQLDVLDRFGGLSECRAEVGEAVKEYNRAKRALEELVGGRRDVEQRLDLLRFQVGEIEAAQVRPEEEDELTVERHLLVNAERLTQLSSSAYDALYGESVGALNGVAAAAGTLHELAAIDPGLGGLAERLLSAQYELQDIAQELRQYRDRVDYDPQRLDSIEERLDLLTRLRRKYGPTLEDVIAFGARAREDLEAVENFDERLDELEGEVAGAAARAGASAEYLSEGRLKAARTLTAAMAEALQGLGLKGTGFQVELTRTPSDDGLPLPGEGGKYSYSLSGIDSVTFLVSFNPGEPLRPLERVASGGETSRFLLALKSVLAEADQTPTLVFDEVDVGVGGRRATDVGERMRDLSRSHQVISITHMPQIAALADRHMTVAKAVRDGRTTVDVRALDSTERVVEIAEMMSGSGTEAARRNAEELLESAQHGR